MQIKTLIRLYWKSIPVVLCILYLSFAPPSTFKEIPTFEIKHLDKIVHLLMYAGLTFILVYDFQKYQKTGTKSLTFILNCLLFPIILGGLVEILQEQFFAPRTAEWGDWLSDIVGVLIGWLAMNLLGKLIKKV